MGSGQTPNTPFLGVLGLLPPLGEGFLNIPCRRFRILRFFKGIGRRETEETELKQISAAFSPPFPCFRSREALENLGEAGKPLHLFAFKSRFFFFFGEKKKKGQKKTGMRGKKKSSPTPQD